jgi:methionyl aminopeptidase
MRKAGRIVADALAMAREIAKEDVSTDDLNTKLEEYVLQKGGIPVFKGYRGYPKSICASINEEIVHGIPDQRKLRNGDILSVDIGVEFNKYVADAAITFPIGEVSEEAESLLHVCEEALNKAIEKTCANNKLSEVSKSIQDYVESNGLFMA